MLSSICFNYLELITQVREVITDSVCQLLISSVEQLQMPLESLAWLQSSERIKICLVILHRFLPAQCWQLTQMYELEGGYELTFSGNKILKLTFFPEWEFVFEQN